jgi:hypothetical protein
VAAPTFSVVAPRAAEHPALPAAARAVRFARLMAAEAVAA